MRPAPSRIRVGIGGWTFAPWRGAFYPKGLPHAQELAFASERLTAIEINGTFHRQQTEASFTAWHDGTPDTFVFAVKAHRATTQSPDPAKQTDAVARFLGSGLHALGPKLGPLLWQFPPARKYDEAEMAAFLAFLPPKLGDLTLRHAIEARHETFLDPGYTALLRQHGVAQVIVDSDKQTLRGDLTADFVYARLQRNEEAAPEGYDTAALDAWAARARAWSKGSPVKDLPAEGSPDKTARDCFVFFISGDKVRAPDAALGFLKRVS